MPKQNFQRPTPVRHDHMRKPGSTGRSQVPGQDNQTVQKKAQDLVATIKANLNKQS